MSTERIKQIREKHPFPWRELVHPNGIVQMVDANGYEVALFDLTGLAVIITNAWATQTPKEKAA